MKILEIASAEEQLALVRVIFDNTWRALKQQAEQQRRAQTKAKPKPNAKPRTAQRAKAGARPIPAFKPIPIASAPNKAATPTTSTQPSTSQASSPPYPPSSVAKKAGDSVSKTQNLGRSNTAQRMGFDDEDRHS